MTDNIYDEIKKHFDENGIIDIPDETSFWMIRTQGGEFYDEFISKRFVALGWNDLTPDLIRRSNEDEAIKNNTKQFIEEAYESKQPGHVFNRCDNFINEINMGDYVIIPGKNRDVIAFAKIISDCYIEEDLSLTEAEYREQVKAEFKDIFNLGCPFNKRRQIDVLKVIDKGNVSPMIYKAMTSYQSLNNITPYDTAILSEVYPVYSYKGSLFLNFHVRKHSDIKAIDYSGFIYSSTLLMSYYTDEELFVKSNINSEGIITLIQSIGSGMLDLLNPSLIPLLLLYGIALGGKIGPIQLNSFYDIWKDNNNRKHQEMMDKANVAKTEAETEKILYELKRRKIEDERLDSAISTVISTSENLEIINLENENQPPNE